MSSSLQKIWKNGSALRASIGPLSRPFSASASASADVLVEYKPGEIGMVSGIPKDHLRRRIKVRFVNNFHGGLHIYVRWRSATRGIPNNFSITGSCNLFAQIKVVIYSPARTATQQGSGKVGRWKINFMSTQKWENPLMGWTSTGDPYAHVGESSLSFDSQEAAMAFAERHGWEYVVKKRHTPLLKVKAYADNFKFRGLPKADDK